jgi:hypothetical protein
MPPTLEELLKRFALEKKFTGKGSLCVALVVTQHARTKGLPLDPTALITERGGQVLGLGRGAVQSILKKHGIDRILAAEGGRTSRGSLNNMRDYVTFLNELHGRGQANLDEVEAFWIERVRAFFAAKPFRIKLDVSRSLRVVVRDLLVQAQERQKTSTGMYYVGAVLQHLVGAKLSCALGPDAVEHNSFSTADAPSGRAGDFFLGDVAIHVTTSPGEALIDRCHENLNAGHRPVLVTLQRGLTVVEALADNKGLSGRIDVFEIEQFVALNVYELGKFALQGRQTAVIDLVNRYNEIIDNVETDPSLRIELR